MPSRAERRWLEHALRAVGFGAIVMALVSAQRPTDGAHTHVVAPRDLRAALDAGSAPGDTLWINSDTTFDPITRDWLGAARAAGVGVRWQPRTPIPATAITLDASRDPGTAARATITAPADLGRWRLRDSLGPLDSVPPGALGATVSLAAPTGATRFVVGAQGASARLPEGRAADTVLVVGRAGWEPKFVAAALEERGWPVALRFSLRPDTATVQGATRLDPKRIAVVVALDASAASLAPQLGGYVRAGGGLVLGAAALRDEAFASLRPGVAGATRPSELLTVPAESPRRGLALIPIGPLAPGAVALERRGDAVAVAARRVGLGRVVAEGFEETWRWRMTGTEGSDEAHRRWWAALVATASPEANQTAAEAVSSSDAPLARQVAALGPAFAGAVPDASNTGRGLPIWVWCLIALGALLCEWISRRTRGER